MFLKKFFAAIGNFFEGLFNAAKRTWNKLSPELQKAMVNGSGVIEAINSNVDKAPSFVLDLIRKKYPDFDTVKLKAALGQLSKNLKIADDIEDPDLETTIRNLQTYLSGLQGQTWAIISNSLANIIAVAVAPKNTKVAAIIQLMEFVYQSFIKKRK